MPTPPSKKPKTADIPIEDQIADVDAKLLEARDRWVEQGSDPKSKLYSKDINNLLDRRARLMEKRDGRKLLMTP